MPKNAASVPVSPPSLLDSSDQNGMLPVTPQRISRLQKQLRSASSPLTPASFNFLSSPFTPMTNTYSSPSSVDTPSSSVSSGTKVDISPAILKFKQGGAADATGNWRARAKENGIKVSVGEDTTGILYAVRGCLDNSEWHRSNLLAGTTDSIPPSFLSTHRRSRQAQFQSKASDATAFTTPMAARLSSAETENITTPSPMKSVSSLNTPSPMSSAAIIARMQARGSLTDPARPRRRAILGSSNGVSLFDIDENSSSNEAYTTSPNSPFPMIRSSRLRSASDSYTQTTSSSFSPRIDSSISLSHSPGTDASMDKTCSVCSSPSETTTLSSLLPCEHLVCSSCLTGALNIVGEKEMRCAVCNAVVADFKLLTPLKLKSSIESQRKKVADLLPSMFDDMNLSSNDGNFGMFDNMSEYSSDAGIKGSQTFYHGDLAVLRIDNVPWDITPPALSEFFAPYILTNAHVLLDPKGKTLSHAYVELPQSEVKPALRSVQNKTLGKGRRMRGVTVTLSSQNELMKAIFPSWNGFFEGCKPSLSGLTKSMAEHTAHRGLISLTELESLVNLMRKPDSHFLKVPSLPFYSLVSILVKFPADVDSTLFWNSPLRDLLFDMTASATDLLWLRAGQSEEDRDVLDRMIRAGAGCAVFTDQQRHHLITKVETKFSTSMSAAPSMSESVSTVSVHSDLGSTHDMVDTSLALAQGFHGQSSQYAHQLHALKHENHSIMQQPLLSPPLGGGFALAMQHEVTSYDHLAREFGVNAQLVHALAQRLAVGGAMPAAAPGQRQQVYPQLHFGGPSF